MKRLLAFLSVLTLGLSACDGGNDDYAARVNGHDISTETILDELHIVTSNPRYVAVLNEQFAGVGGLQPTGDNSVSAEYTAQALFNRVIVELIDETYNGQKLSTTPEETAQAEETVKGDLGDDVFDDMPTSYREYLVSRLAKLSAVMRSRDTVEAERAYYDAHKNELQQYCVRHILVNSQTQAAQLRKQIVDDGASFATLATQSSLDNQGAGSSAENGGALGCFSRTDLGQFIAEFRDAALSLPVGEVSQPVQTQFGFHLIEVTSADTPTFDAAKSDISKQLSDIDTYINETLGKATIKVNPRFGTYQQANATTGASAGIKPPSINAVTPKTTVAPIDPSQLGGGGQVPQGTPSQGDVGEQTVPVP